MSRACLSRLIIEKAKIQALFPLSATLDFFRWLIRVLFRAAPPMKVSSASTVPIILSMLPGVLRVPNTMQHDPRGLLSHLKGACDFTRRNAFLQLASIHIAQIHLSNPRGGSSKIVPTMTEYYFVQARHFHIR
jgi:hypothetical protein